MVYSSFPQTSASSTSGVSYAAKLIGDEGGYFGLGGNASVKRDRFGKFHVGIQGGIGFGKAGISITGGKLLQSAKADPGQIALAVDGWGMGFQGGYWLGGTLPVVNTGPQPIQYGLSTPGFAAAGGYTWQIP